MPDENQPNVVQPEPPTAEKDAIANPEPTQGSPSPVNEQLGDPKKPKTKLLLILLLVLLIGAVAYWTFVMQDSKTKTPSSSHSTSTTTETATEDDSDNPQTLVYSYHEKDSAPYKIYWRDAEGGNRTEAMTIKTDGYATNAITYQNKVAFVVEGFTEDSIENAGVWYSTDNGGSYDRIFKLEHNDQVTSMIFSVDGKYLIVGYLPEEGNNNVKAIDLTTKKITTLFKADFRGVFLAAYSPAKKQVLYFGGCYNCDGNSFSQLRIRDLGTDKDKVFLDGKQTASFNTVVADADFEELIIVKETLDLSIETDGIPGYYTGPPYTIETVKISDKSKKVLKTVGKKNDESSLIVKGTGYTADTGEPYYAVGKKIYVFTNNKESLRFESSKNIEVVYYVGKDNVIFESASNQFAVNNYSIKNKKLITLLNGNYGTTRIFGVTTAAD